jgi:7-carboxy-7-deazaguanine synthase
MPDPAPSTHALPLAPGQAAATGAPALDASSADPSRAPESRHDALRISETFYSVQGEGTLTGVPSLFIRVSGCNLRCAWCDTPYASWRPEGPVRTVDDLLAEAARTPTPDAPVRHAVVTGGEPLLFDAIEPLCAGLRARGVHVTIETAGTVFRDLRPGLGCDLMSISPKLAGSTPRPGDPRDPSGAWRERHERTRTNIPALQALLDRYPQRQLKFVVTAALPDAASALAPDVSADLNEIDDLLSRLRGWNADDVLLMPEGVTAPLPAVKAAVVDHCLRRGWRYCTRLHIDLFGNRRGT